MRKLSLIIIVFFFSIYLASQIINADTSLNELEITTKENYKHTDFAINSLSFISTLESVEKKDEKLLSPTINIISPTPKNYSFSSIWLNVTAYPEPDIWEYEINNDGERMEFTPNTTIIVNQCFNDLKVFANSEGDEGTESVQFYVLEGDIDEDRDIDIFDIVKCVGAYKSTSFDEGYIPECDIVTNDKIDIFDIVKMVENYGKTCIEGPPTFRALNSAGNPENQKHYWNGTWQVEDFIHINTTVTDTTEVDTVWVGWYNGTWYNLTMNNQLGTDYYYINITNQPKYYGYTFDIYANDSLGIEAKIYNWTYLDYEGGMRSWGPKENFRKYIGLKGTQYPFEYEQLYLHSFSYPIWGAMDRCLPHEQPAGQSSKDTGVLLYEKPKYPNEILCGGFTGNSIDETITNNSLTIKDFYLHVWWQTVNEKMVMGYEKETNDQMDADFDESYLTDVNNAKRKNFDMSSLGFKHTNYSLEIKYFDNSDTIFNDNDINLFFFKTLGVDQGPMWTSVISTENYPSFIIFNLPDDTTLQGLDTDSDGLNDYNELFQNYTDPKDTDTDNGGESDYDEAINSRDPLNPSDDIIIQPIIRRREFL